uniref:Uncharacterized protein n=1 Tax=Rhizophora mucronata TaxID=61149 RepID=A0A2P2QSY9_RHIMU
MKCSTHLVFTIQFLNILSCFELCPRRLML